MDLKIDSATLLTVLGSAWAWIQGKKETWDYIVKVTTPLIIEAEKLAQDGSIDKADRKALVMMAVAKLEADGKIKLNFITRWMLGKVVNSIAKKLPDFKIGKNAKEVIDLVVKNVPKTNFN